MPFWDKGNQDPFEILRNLGDLKDIQKLLGPDFFKNLPMTAGDVRTEGVHDTTSESFPVIDIYDSGGKIILWANIPG